MTNQFYQQKFIQREAPTQALAKELLGYRLVSDLPSGRVAGWLVEVEAYLGKKDQAAHVYGGRRTPSLEAFYQAGGIWYIYTIHGHLGLNMITQDKTQPEGILLRAVEPCEGQEIMKARRGRGGRELTNGPGKMTQAFAVDKERDYGKPSWQAPLYIDFTARREPQEIHRSPRIGIPNKGEWTEKPLRFSVAGNPYVSRFMGQAAKNNGWKV